MLFWSNSSTAPRSEASSSARALLRRAARSRAKSTRCSQSTAIVAPRDAIIDRPSPLAFSNGKQILCRASSYPWRPHSDGQQLVRQHTLRGSTRLVAQGEQAMRIAILGLGRMGAAIAERLALTDHELSVWNRSPAASEPFAARKLRVLAAPAEAFAHADLVITMLADDAALESVALDQGLLAAAPAGRTLVDMSTIGVESSE